MSITVYDLNLLWRNDKYQYILVEKSILPGPTCSRHRLLNELVNDNLFNCCSYSIFKDIDIFCLTLCMLGKNFSKLYFSYFS